MAAPRGKSCPGIKALAQLVLDGGIQLVTADHIGMHRWMLLVFLGSVEGLNRILDLLSGGTGLLLPPGMVELVEAVQRFPPAFLLDQLDQPALFQLIAVPDLHQRCTELAHRTACVAFQGFQQVECFLKFTFTKQCDSLILEGLLPAIEGLAMDVKVAMA